jgi:hypothetical protein
MSQNRRKDVDILGSLLDRLRNPLHFFWGTMGAMQHNGQFTSASAFGQLGFHQARAISRDSTHYGMPPGGMPSGSTTASLDTGLRPDRKT